MFQYTFSIRMELVLFQEWCTFVPGKLVCEDQCNKLRKLFPGETYVQFGSSVIIIASEWPLSGFHLLQIPPYKNILLNKNRSNNFQRETLSNLTSLVKWFNSLISSCCASLYFFYNWDVDIFIKSPSLLDHFSVRVRQFY